MITTLQGRSGKLTDRQHHCTLDTAIRGDSRRRSSSEVLLTLISLDIFEESTHDNFQSLVRAVGQPLADPTLPSVRPVEPIVYHL